MEDPITLEEPPAGHERAWRGDLAKRLVSGLIFAALAILLAWSGQMPFALLVLVVAVVMSWEWARVVRGVNVDLTLAVHAVAVATATILAAFGYAALGLAALAVGAIIVVPLQFGGRPITSAAGVLYAGLPAVAMLWLRGDGPAGFRAVLLILLVVWATDIAAYACGRLIGGPRLAPAVSPNKTWSGLIGGIAAGTATAALFAVAADAPTAQLAISGLVMGLVAQAGDLVESAWKRAFGVKDASAILPGHGGFMDRMDGLVAVAVAAALFALFVNAHAPAEAIVPRVWP